VYFIILIKRSLASGYAFLKNLYVMLFFTVAHINDVSRDSEVGIAIGYGLDD
jgi:hypothetical protein